MSIVHKNKARSPGQSWELTRLKSPFGRLLHLFLVPECDFSLGYHSAEEVANDRDPERRPTTAFSREVAEVEKSIEYRTGLARCRDAPRSDLSRMEALRHAQHPLMLFNSQGTPNLKIQILVIQYVVNLLGCSTGTGLLEKYEICEIFLRRR